MILIISLERIKLNLQLAFSLFLPTCNVFLDEQKKALLTPSITIYKDLEFLLKSMNIDKWNGGEKANRKHSGSPFTGQDGKS